MCDIICDVITCCVSSCDMGKINVYDEIMIENKQKIWKSKQFLHESLSNRWFRN